MAHSRPGARASSTSMIIEGRRPLSPWLRPLRRIAAATALVAAGWFAIVVALTFASAPGKSMAIVGPPARAMAAGALLVLDAEQAGGCGGLPPRRAASL